MFFQQFTIQTYADDITQDSTPITENVTEVDENETEEVNTSPTTVTESSEEQENPQEEVSKENGADQTSTQENENEEKQVEVQSDEASVMAVKLVDKGTTVWGNGIITGSGDMDDKSWNRNTNENKGYDSATDNDIIRSFDSITYNVSATFSNLTVGADYTLVYEVTLP